MAITDEQRAMLQLLLEGGQGYDDIGSLLGIAPDEVRSRARAALGEIGGSDPDAQVALSDYLLGQADPIGRADAVRHLQNDPEANALADRLLTQLRLLAPKAQLPEIPAARGGRRAPAPPPPPVHVAEGAPTAAQAPTAPGTRGPSAADRVAGLFSRLGGLGGKRRTQLAVGVVAALALVVAVVVVTSSSGGDGGGKSDCPTVDTTQAQQAGLPAISLEAAQPAAEGECAPTGQLTLVSSKKQAAFQVNAAGLQPTASGESYIIWLYRTDQQSLPIDQQASADGNLTRTIPIPQQVAQLIATGAFQSVRVSLATASEVQGLQQQSQGNQASIPPFVGTNILEGALPQPAQSGQGASGATPGGAGTAPQAPAPTTPKAGAGK